jgi:hypothetical protein
MRRGHDGRAGTQTDPGRFAFRDPFRRVSVKRAAAGLVLAVGLIVAGGRGGAGHQVGHYPSYYPDEIRIDAVDPAAAAKGLTEETLHAYIGAAPSFAGPVPEQAGVVKSLGGFLVLSFDMASARFASADARCAAARGILAGLSEEKSGGFVFHPYPLTPFHADYLHHLDRIEAAKSFLGGDVSTPATKVAAKGQLAETIVRARWDLGASDVVLEAVPVGDLLADAGVQLGGWSGPPWIKEGWFHAYGLLSIGLDSAEREAADRDYQQLVRGQARSFAEHAELERRLVAALTIPCRRMVVGYTLKEEYFNDKYPEGIENVAYDSLGGLNAPIFIRTAKLKDYPWNGKLHLGVRDRPEAAWNPVAGFTDPMGRLIWSAVGDPAMIPFPSNASWMPNRVQSEVARVVGQSGGLKVPADAVCPQPGSGALQRVGDRTFASAKVVYEVVASPFEDGTEMAVADLLYPFVFTYRWGAGPDAGPHEPRLKSVLASLQERLVGLKLLRVDKTTLAVAEGLNIVVQTPVLEVYLKDAPGDDRQAAALAPPWSTVPWHLLALMEEAVIRGHAAFSQEEAARRRVPWLDLVRDAALEARLVELIAQFERESYRPEPLKDLVTADEAQARWRSLRAFAEKNSHLLVTNGPYRLKQWTPQSVVLEAVRELTYPLGFGTFDRFVNPPRAVLGAVAQEASELVVRADAEMVLKAGRKYQLVKEPLLRTTTRGVDGMLVVSRYLLIGPDGRVLKADKMQWAEDGHFAIKLPEDLPAGQYTAILGIFLDGNAVQPSTKIVPFRVGERTGAPG